MCLFLCAFTVIYLSGNLTIGNPLNGQYCSLIFWENFLKKRHFMQKISRLPTLRDLIRIQRSGKNNQLFTARGCRFSRKWGPWSLGTGDLEIFHSSTSVFLRMWSLWHIRKSLVKVTCARNFCKKTLKWLSQVCHRTFESLNTTVLHVRSGLP